MSKSPSTVILVVEDEPLLRLFAADMIQDAGFEVLQASSSAAAIGILESRRDVKVVFTDVEMPGGVDGITLAGCIRDRWPPIEILITSGKPLPTGVAIPKDAVFVSKPYRQDRVVEMIGRMAA